MTELIKKERKNLKIYENFNVNPKKRYLFTQ